MNKKAKNARLLERRFNKLSSQLRLVGLIGIVGGGAGWIASMDAFVTGAIVVFGVATLWLGEHMWSIIRRHGEEEERLSFGAKDNDLD